MLFIKKMLRTALLFLLLNQVAVAQSPAAPNFCYDLSRPVLVASLPPILNELSGISLAAEPSEMLAIQDELGEVFRLSIQDGQILGRIPFAKPGDFEDLCLVADDIWVLKSNGTLYCIPANGGEVLKFTSEIQKEEDAEGLAYDAAQQRLLIACKGAKEGENDRRKIYAFDLKTQRFSTTAVFEIHQADFALLLEKYQSAKWYEKLQEFLLAPNDFGLGPSALAIHPVSSSFYLLSSRSNLLLVLSPDGQLQQLHRFKKEYLPQAEGLFFTPDATLYISTEARGKEAARIYRFNYLPGCPEQNWND